LLNTTKSGSKEMVIKTGVPQGSILGPILFLLYINDIEHSSKLLSFILFADDTNIFYSTAVSSHLIQLFKWK
jgi:hypothetical protein